MTHSIARICQTILFAGLSSLAGVVAAAQEPQQVPTPPGQPFIAMHTFVVRPEEEKPFLAAIREINAAIARAGCPTCIYHEFKIRGPQSGPDNYMQVSYWPSDDIYVKVHASPDFIAVNRRLSDITARVYRAQTYNRYVEVKP